MVNISQYNSAEVSEGPSQEVQEILLVNSKEAGCHLWPT